MTRRGLFAPLIGGLVAGCSPLSLLNTLGPRDGGVRRVARGLAYGSDSRQALDIYAPTGAAGLPVVVFFYGGAWDSGSRDQYGWAAQALASRGFVVALPDYRLVPQVRFPDFITDAAQATAFVADVAARYGGDARRLGVAGHSAGAHLAMMVALDARYMQAVGRGGLIRAAAGLAGPYEFLPLNVRSAIAAFGDAPDPTQTQPITFARGDGPALWLGHGSDDDVVHAEDSVLLDAAVRQAGGRSELVIYPGLNHADLIATFSPLFRGRAPVLDDVAAFLNRTLTPASGADVGIE